MQITLEDACALAGIPYPRGRQYLKRGQFKLDDLEAGWTGADVLRFVALGQLTSLGVRAGRAAEFVRQPALAEMWEQLGCRGLDLLTAPDGPCWYLVITRAVGCGEPSIAAFNNRQAAQWQVFPATGPGPRLAVVLNATEIAIDVRRKLEALAGGLR
jgi:hypothetical protein